MKDYNVLVYFDNREFTVKAKNLREAKTKARKMAKRKTPIIQDLYVDEQ